MQNQSYTKGSLNLKAIVPTKLRETLDELNKRTNDGLISNADFMYPINFNKDYQLGINDDLNKCSNAMPITSQWLLSHLITERCLNLSFKDLLQQMDSIIPIQSDQPIFEYIIEKSLGADGQTIDLPLCMQNIISDTPYLQLSSNQLHLALTELSKSSNVSKLTIHNDVLLKSMLSAQFSAAVKDVKFDMYSMPDETHRQKATDDIYSETNKQR